MQTQPTPHITRIRRPGKDGGLSDTERDYKMLALFAVLLLMFVIMPALLLWFGYMVKRYLAKPPSFIGFPIDGATLRTERLAADRDSETGRKS
jgi:hypothetical protein